MSFLLFSILLFTVVGCSSNQAAVDEAIAEGLTFIEEEAYEKAEESFQSALELKPEDELATNLLLQTQLIQGAFDDLENGELESAVSAIEEIIVVENGSEHLILRANEVKQDIDELSGKLEDLEALLLQTEELLDNEEIVDLIEILEEALAEDLDHVIFEDVKKDLEIQLVEAKSIQEKIEKEREEAERKAAEERAKKEAEEKARHEAEKKAAEQAKQVADFTGYWLNDEFACHMTTSYMTCAMPYSDFITYDDITNIKPLNSTEVEVTSADGHKTVFKLSNNNSTLQVPGGTYKRVSKDEANAIFDGYYELQ